MFIIESIMEHVGETLGIPSEVVKQKNLYEKGQVQYSDTYVLHISMGGYTYIHNSYLKET